jgi:hypothetical protein
MGRLSAFFALSYLLKLVQLEGQLRERVGSQYEGA